jgi:hypothetical protein
MLNEEPPTRIGLTVLTISARRLENRLSHWLGALGLQLSSMRRKLLPTEGELDRRYLDGAVDRYDLEMRMRELDRPRSRDKLLNPFR